MQTKFSAARRIGAFVVLVLLALVVVAAAHVSSASALEVTGYGDTAGDLVVQPDVLQTSVVEPVQGVEPIVLISRMPATKTITSVTLGELGRGPSCGEDSEVYLNIYGTDPLDPINDNGTLYKNSAGTQTLGAATRRVTWDLASPVTLVQGHAYAFRVLHGSGCNDVVQRTWSHPGQVRGGSGCVTMPILRMADGSPVEPFTHWRLWHVNGVEDNPPLSCINVAAGSHGAFSADMPTGWLAVVTYNGYSQYVRESLPSTCPSNVCERCTDPVFANGWNASDTFWYTDPDGFINNSVCTHPQFADPANAPKYGWINALPWRTDDAAAPRDMYVKLTSPDYAPLLEQYKPHLQYDAQEAFRAERIESLMDVHHVGVTMSNWPSETVTLNHAAEDSIGAHFFATGDASAWPGRDLGLPSFDSTWLTTDSVYPDVGSLFAPNVATPSGAGDWIDEPNVGGKSTYQADAHATYDAGDEGSIYGRAVADASGTLYLQYWFWYYYNDGKALGGGGDHEGDWESIQLTMGADGTPTWGTYAAHEFANKCSWSNLTVQGTTHPVVYVTEGRHASYPGLGEWPHDLAYTDSATATGALVDPSAVQISADTPWAVWPGQWGDDTGQDADPLDLHPESSPGGPASHTEWADPRGFELGAQEKCVGSAPGPPATGSTVRRLKMKSMGDGTVRIRYSLSGHGRLGHLLVSFTSNGKSTPYTYAVPARHWRGSVRVKVPHGVIIPATVIVSGVSTRAWRSGLERGTLVR